MKKVSRFKSRIADLEKIITTSYMSGLTYTQFHDYVPVESYDEWKWFFKYAKEKDDMDEAFLGRLNKSLSEVLKSSNAKLNDTTSCRIVDIDASSVPDAIEATLGRMEGYYNRNKDTINSLSISKDLKEGFHTWNDDMYAMVVNIKDSIFKSIKEDDKELFIIEPDDKGVYVWCNVINNQELYDWFLNQGITPVSAEEMHTTIAYSRKDFNHTLDSSTITIPSSDLLEIAPLGNEGCVVVKMRSDALQARFNTCMDEGATYDYDSYIPHITIAMNVPEEVISTLILPTFDIILGEEYMTDLDGDSISDVDSEGYARDFIDALKKELGQDSELFGFGGTKYQSDIHYTAMEQFLVGSSYYEALWETFGKKSPVKDMDFAYTDLLKKIDVIKNNISVGTAKVKMRVVKPESHIVDDAKHNKIMKFLDDTYEKNKQLIDTYDIRPDRKAKLQTFNKEMYGCLKKIRTILKNNIKPVKGKDKESMKLESYMDKETGVISMVSTPVSYADVESFTAISGVVSNGFKKISEVVSSVSELFSVSNTDYSKLTSNFIFSKDKKYQDVYNMLVGVPAGYNGYLLDACKHIKENISFLDRLDGELTAIIDILTLHINSAEYRESFAMDMTRVKQLEASTTVLYTKNKEFFTNSRDDSKSIGKLIRSANEVDMVVNMLKEITKEIDVDKLEPLKRKMKEIDNCTAIMVVNKNLYSKNRLLELSRLIDGAISLSNAVGTLVYLKSVVDTIVLDIKAII